MLVGRDVLSGKSVKAEAAGSLLSRPRARQRIGTSSEALRGGATGEGASGEVESWYLIRGLAAWASGESENLPRPAWLPLGFGIYKV